MASGAIENPIYQPAMRTVTNITNAEIPTVTTSFAHNYYDTDIVRFFLPLGFGMSQIHNKVSRIMVTSDTEFTIDIDTSGFDTFVDPANGQYAQVLPIGEENSTVRGATKNTLPTYVR